MDIIQKYKDDMINIENKKRELLSEINNMENDLKKIDKLIKDELRKLPHSIVYTIECKYKSWYFDNEFDEDELDEDELHPFKEHKNVIIQVGCWSKLEYAEFYLPIDDYFCEYDEIRYADEKGIEKIPFQGLCTYTCKVVKKENKDINPQMLENIDCCIPNQKNYIPYLYYDFMKK